MTVRTGRDLFLYELGIMRDAERAGCRLLEWIGSRVQNGDLAQLIRAQEQESRLQLTNIHSCLRILGASPLETPSATVEGIHSRFQLFTTLRPAPEVLDLFALGTALRFLYFGISSYRTLFDWAELMGERQCVETLRANLVQKESGAGGIERLGREMGERLLTPA